MFKKNFVVSFFIFCCCFVLIRLNLIFNFVHYEIIRQISQLYKKIKCFYFHFLFKSVKIIIDKAFFDFFFENHHEFFNILCNDNFCWFYYKHKMSNYTSNSFLFFDVVVAFFVVFMNNLNFCKSFQSLKCIFFDYCIVFFFAFFSVSFLAIIIDFEIFFLNVSVKRTIRKIFRVVSAFVEKVLFFRIFVVVFFRHHIKWNYEIFS